jgi:FlaA1/EpsC-like NDP-sugar epimerase
MIAQFSNTRFYLVLLADGVIFISSFLGAYLIRFDFSVAPPYSSQLFRMVPLVLPSKLFIFLLFGSYKGMWRYTGLKELWRLAQASFLSMIVCTAIAVILHGLSLKGVPRSVFLIDALLTFFLCAQLRVIIRLFFLSSHAAPRPWFAGLSERRRRLGKTPCLIIGAGQAGEKIYREIRDNSRLNYTVVGFLDDAREKWGRSLHGATVYGGVHMLPEVLKKKRKIDEVLIAIPSATGAQMRRILEICKRCNVRYKTLPEIGAIIDGKVSIKSLRDVRYEDLLRRPPLNLDIRGIRQYLQGKRVLVTGAGGSIGSELCRQIIQFKPKELILVEASELNLFNIQMELQHELNFPYHRCFLSQVQNRLLMNDIFSACRPQLVFHAAAYKHVPMLENNPWEAISNNVLASQVIMELAQEYEVELFVLVSTDKAVRPTNVMGASKRLAELILQSLQGNGTRYMAVRFGNVIGSSGSVLPLFRRQLEHGGPITVTHPEATRYFMTIPEAAHLILQAGGLGEGGEIFILEMGTPVNIAQMAEELVRLSGKEPGEDVEIIFTGLREGEKLHEELISDNEDIMGTSYKKILVLRSSGWNGKKTQKEFSEWLFEALDSIYRIASNHDGSAIRDKLREILPDYVPEQEVSCLLSSNSKDSAAAVNLPPRRAVISVVQDASCAPTPAEPSGAPSQSQPSLQLKKACL